MDIWEARRFFREHRVCFVTNADTYGRSPLIWSLKSYINLIDENFVMYPAVVGNRRLYGAACFYTMCADLLYDYDYIIYIDDDAFLVTGSEGAVVSMLKRFIGSGALVGGVPDGGVLCHRNHNPYMINAFVSFWNLKKIRMGLTKNEILSQDFLGELKQMTFDKWAAKADRESLDRMESWWHAVAEDSAGLMKGVEVPYADIVKNDPSNPVEPHQTPWSVKCDDYEPYYRFIELLLSKCGGTVWYFNARDKVSGGGDDSGLTSEIYERMDGKVVPVFWHTWFSRKFADPNSPHHDRIASVVAALGLS